MNEHQTDEVERTVRHVARLYLVAYLIGLAVVVGLILTKHLSIWVGSS